MSERPDVAVIGGSGFYTFLDDAETVEVDTPYGPPSAPIVVGTVDDRRVAFLPRHGRHHEFPAHTVPYRANMWALRSLGVRQVLAPCAVGSLKEELGPGSLVVPDQLVDRTTDRVQTYFDSGACHVAFADPYCGRLRGDLLKGLAEHEPTDGGAMVVIDGPRFSTRAESQWYAAQGWSLVNMTGHPEAILARELTLCYAAVALVTDHDAGVDAGGAVSQAEVFKVFGEYTEVLRSSLRGIVAGLAPSTGGGSGPRAEEGTAEGRDCECSHAVDGMDLPVELP